jgi:hypothetical protein
MVTTDTDSDFTGMFQKDFMMVHCWQALVQWYVVLISSTLKGWRNWCNDRRVKKQRQAQWFAKTPFRHI